MLCPSTSYLPGTWCASWFSARESCTCSRATSEVLFDFVDVPQVFYLYVECQLEVLLDLFDVA